MKKLLVGLVCLGTVCLGQNVINNVSQINFANSLPLPPANVNANVVGNGGPNQAYYWVVAHFASGLVTSPSPSPAIVRNVPSTLSGSNYVQVGWTPVASASTYDVLKTVHGSIPVSGNILLASGLTDPSYQDQGANPSSYTVSTSTTNSCTASYDTAGALQIPCIVAGSGVHSFNARTGDVVPLIGDYSAFYAPIHVASGVAGAVQLSGGGNTLTSDASNFFWDSTNHRLGVGTNTPATAINVWNGAVEVDGSSFPAIVVSDALAGGSADGSLVSLNSATLTWKLFHFNAANGGIFSDSFLIQDGSNNDLVIDKNHNAYVAGNVGSTGAGATLVVYANGHELSQQSVVPNLSSCTNGQLQSYSTDRDGTIIIAGTHPSTCQLNFHTAYTVLQSCIVTGSTAGTYISGFGGNAIIFNGLNDNETVFYHCSGQ